MSGRLLAYVKCISKRSPFSYELLPVLAHEIGHLFGAGHTHGYGGLMDYNDERAIYDDGAMCGFLFGSGSDTVPSGCLSPASAA